MSEAKRKCRQYNTNYLMYGFIPSPSNAQLPIPHFKRKHIGRPRKKPILLHKSGILSFETGNMCLLCNRVLSNEAMKPSLLQEHLQKIHTDKQNKNLLFFTNIRDKFLKAPSVSDLLTTSSTQCDDGLIAFYNISKLIAKSGKAHTIGE